MFFKRSLLIAAAGTAIFLGDLTAASADTWRQDHPFRAQVNSRLNNQNARINRDCRDGEITGAQAARLHSEDHAMRTQERLDARSDGGHITRGEQGALNREENGVSRQIYNTAH